MCGILYKSNLKTITNHEQFIKSLELLNHRGPDDTGVLFTDIHSLGHKRLSIINPSLAKQPMSILNNHLIYNGEIYNSSELKGYLHSNLEFESDTLLLLKLLNEYNVSVLDKINGIFSFVYATNDGVIAARDMFGVKPLYYSFIDNDIIIASEIKAILNYKGDAVVDKEGLCELMGMGPSHSVSKTVYKGIYELEPGHYLRFDNDGFKKVKYYYLPVYKHSRNYSETVSDIKSLVTNAINRQTVSDVGISCLLSGGLDSSIIATVLSKTFKGLDTYSIDYENNQIISNDFEISKDSDYIELVSKAIGSKQNNIVITNDILVDYLKRVVFYRDSPGMTDIDASMHHLTNAIAKDNKVSVSGECADEIFGGYPWFYKKVNEDGFPWITNIEFKESLLKNEIKDKLKLKDYVYQEYDRAVKEAPVLANESKLDRDKRILTYLNMNYFMTNLLDRKDRMSMGSSLEVRVPFCDKDLVGYLYNVPYKFKYRLKKEKKLLRDAFKDEVIKEVINRKKSPYPKSNSIEYENKVRKLFLDIVNNESSRIHELFDKDKLIALASEGEFDVPWYGQLMRKTSLMAYIYQIEYWLNKYNVRIEI